MIVYKGRLLKKSSLANQKLKLIQSTLVTTWLSNIAFHLLPIWLQTLVAIDSELCQTLFQSFCVLPSEVTVLFKWNLSRLPFLGQVVNLDLLLCTRYNSEHVALFLCHNFTQSLIKDWKIQKSDGHYFGSLRQQLLANAINNFISHKKWFVAARNLQIIKTFWTLEDLNWVSITRVVARFPQSSRLLPHSDSRQLGNTMCLF